MKLKRFNEFFNNDTIELNNREYKNYLNNNKDDRTRMVAWEAPRSQSKNFNMVSNLIKNNDSVLDYGCGVGDFINHLKEKNITISDYLGVDINDEFIEIAKETYPENKFQLIKGIEEIKGNYDIVCAIGVFTWYINREDFIQSIRGLHKIANKKLILTCLNSYKGEIEDTKSYWSSKYRKYTKDFFKKLFPDLKFKFQLSPEQDTLLVVISK